MKLISSFKEYTELVESGKPFAIDFMAAWCGPCRSFGATLEKLEDEYKDRCDFAKCDVDGDESEMIMDDILAKYNVRVQSVPTFVMVDGDRTMRCVGAKSAQGTKDMIEDFLNNK